MRVLGVVEHVVFATGWSAKRLWDEHYSELTKSKFVVPKEMLEQGGYLNRIVRIEPNVKSTKVFLEVVTDKPEPDPKKIYAVFTGPYNSFTGLGSETWAVAAAIRDELRKAHNVVTIKEVKLYNEFKEFRDETDAAIKVTALAKLTTDEKRVLGLS